MQNNTIQFATRLRGFFKQLFSSSYLGFHIETSENSIYEVNSRVHNIKAKLIRSKLADWLGIIQRIKVIPKSGVNIIGSYNRFIHTELQYFIYIENPTALYHYTLSRSKSYLGKKHLKKYLNDPNLRGLIFMSKACEKTFDILVGLPNQGVIRRQIYPLIKRNTLIDEEYIEKNYHSADITFLYIAQGIRFDSKGGYEVIEAFNRLSKIYPRIYLTIVTNIDKLPESVIKYLYQNNNIILQNFTLSPQQMQELYSKSDILLQPTSDDSFGLTILEALHSGLAIIASELYSIPEIVEDGENGYLVKPHYWFFNKEDLLPNPNVWNHRKQTIHSGRVSSELIEELQSKMKILIEDRQQLIRMKLNSFRKAQLPPFSEEYITTQWNSFVEEIGKI